MNRSHLLLVLVVLASIAIVSARMYFLFVQQTSRHAIAVSCTTTQSPLTNELLNTITPPPTTQTTTWFNNNLNRQQPESTTTWINNNLD
jgi:uncharacterized protein YfdQ (DUF2303 family)